MVPGAPGVQRPEKHPLLEYAVDEMVQTLLPEVKKLGVWARLEECIRDYVATHDILKPFPWDIPLDNLYLTPLLSEYLDRSHTLSYKSRTAGKAISLLQAALHDDQIEVHATLALEFFKAECPFTLSGGAKLYPISKAEAIEFGRLQSYANMRGGFDSLGPSMLWWLCNITAKGPRETFVAQNQINEIKDQFSMALRAFKTGSFKIGLLRSRGATRFFTFGEVRGTHLQTGSNIGAHYTLNKREVGQFKRFHKKLVELFQRPTHYLQLPIRRLVTAGLRTTNEDRLVDYVIGLEALLGLENERTELSYKFRMRGAVILAEERRHRKSYVERLKDLYNLRSKIVHGAKFPAEEVQTALPFAEDAVRRVWKWFFKNHSRAATNKPAIKAIDELLVS